jgi:hypothetical protein
MTYMQNMEINICYIVTLAYTLYLSSSKQYPFPKAKVKVIFNYILIEKNNDRVNLKYLLA